MNFGLCATPERNLLFDINDFDETLPAPREWDIKRLVVSFAVAARDNGRSGGRARNAAIECARAYQEHLRDDSKKNPLDVYRLQDFVLEVVGIGSGGTRCFVALFVSAEGHPLLVQFTEARHSVLAPYAGESVMAIKDNGWSWGGG